MRLLTMRRACGVGRLDFNAITMSLSNETFGVAGLYFLGFGHWFIRFPRVIQTIEFAQERGNSLLHTRTADGLPLTLGLSFQYRYQPEKLHALYLKYKGDHQTVFINTAIATIANVACNYSAYTFFNDKQGIAIAMQSSLRTIFAEQLYASIEALQISQVELPTSFQARESKALPWLWLPHGSSSHMALAPLCRLGSL